MTTSILHALEQSHPPISRLRWFDRVALHFGLLLIRWVDGSEQRRSRRIERQREEAARLVELNALREELRRERLRAESYLGYR